MKVSVVIATFGREQPLCDTIAAMLAQAYDDFELIVVDQTATHDTATTEFLAAHRERIRYIQEPRPSVTRARNIGLEAARGDVVLFVDDDVVPDDGDLIARHAERYADAAVGCVAGRVRESTPPNGPAGVAKVTLFGRIVVNYSGEHAAEVQMAKGANMSCRRDAIASVGGFDTRYGGTAVLEEADACYRLRAAGWKVIYEPRASLRHLLSPHGGCRAATLIDGRYWLFHNSALFYRKLKPAGGLPLFVAFFAARGVLHVVQAGGTVSDYVRLLRGLARGLRAAASVAP